MTAEASPAPVTVIGLGMMGSALAGAFLAAGHRTTVWNRSPGRAGPLVERGAAPAASVVEAVAASEIVVVCVLDYEAVRAVLEPSKEALAGKVLVNLTSGLPEQARAAADWAERLGAHYVDGKIMSVPQGIGAPETLLLYAGSRSTFEANLATLGALGGNNVHLGADPGTAALYDFSLLGIMWATLAGALHAFALAGSEGVPASALMPLAGSLLAHIGPLLDEVARQVDVREYTTDVSTVGLNALGLAKMVEFSKARGVRPDLMIPIRDFLDRRVADGHGADALASLIEVIKSPER